MTTTWPRAFRLAALAAAFFLAIGVFALLHGGQGSLRSAAPRSAIAPPPPNASTDTLIAAYQRILGTRPGNVSASATLASAYLQKVRETGDPSYYVRADGVLQAAQRTAPHDYRILAGLGTLALARHQFASGLHYGLAALQADPSAEIAYPVIVDGQVELGRYRDAARTLQRFVDSGPTLASYARVSYFRELHGDLAGAVQAMRLAVSAGGAVPENVAYVQTLLGNLEFDLGHLGQARDAYRTGLHSFPRYVAADAGLARLDAAQARFASAIARYRGIVARLPLPEYVVGLGETELASGNVSRGIHDLALVRAEEKLLQANGVNTDTDLALFEANHGSPAAALGLARRAWAEAPSVRSADALGWALSRDGRPGAGLGWARHALMLGSRDPMFLYHAGMSALAAGDRVAARGYLRRAVALNPRFNPLYAPRAERALAHLG